MIYAVGENTRPRRFFLQQQQRQKIISTSKSFSKHQLTLQNLL